MDIRESSTPWLKWPPLLAASLTSGAALLGSGLVSIGSAPQHTDHQRGSDIATKLKALRIQSAPDTPTPNSPRSPA